MTVQELIAKLKTLPPDAKVKVWNLYDDCETCDVFVLESAMGKEV